MCKERDEDHLFLFYSGLYSIQIHLMVFWSTKAMPANLLFGILWKGKDIEGGDV